MKRIIRTCASVALFALASTFSSATVPKQSKPNKPPEKKSHLQYLDRLQWRKIIGWSYQCEKDWVPRDINRGGMTFWSVEPCLYLVEVHCGCGAYQCWSEYFLYDENNSECSSMQLIFLDIGRVLDSNKYYYSFTDVLSGRAEYIAQNHTLTITYLGMGLGYCRSVAKYRISREGAELIEYRDKWQCDDKWLDDDKLPQIFP